jgi:transcription antitermination factor NusG
MSGQPVDWYIVRTPPAREPAAAHTLKARGFEVYAPMKVIWRRRRHELLKRQVALFPSYVFVGLSELTPDGETLRITPFVAALVTIDGINPARIRTPVIEELRQRFGELTTGPKFHRWIAGKAFGIGDMVELVGEVTPWLRGVPFKVEHIRGQSAVLMSKLFTATVVARIDNLQAVA